MKLPPRVREVIRYCGTLKEYHEVDDAERLLASSETGLMTIELGKEYLSLAEHLSLVDHAKHQAREELWEELNKWKPTLHFCRDWDFLLIENGDPEFGSCGCGPFPLKYLREETGNRKQETRKTRGSP